MSTGAPGHSPNPDTGEGYANPVVGGEMTSRDGRVTLRIPGGAVDRMAKLWYQKYCGTEVPAPSAWKYVGCPFDLRAVDVSDETVALSQFRQPVRATIRYTDIEAQGLDEVTFRLAYYDGSQWVPYPSQVDAQTNTVTGQVGHFSLHALLGSATPAGSVVSGRAFYDRNGDGVYNGDGFPIAKAGVRIVGEGYYSFTTTEQDGRYSFGSLKGGRYAVSAVVGPEWGFTTPERVADVAVSGKPDSKRSDADFGMRYRVP